MRSFGYPDTAPRMGVDRCLLSASIICHLGLNIRLVIALISPCWHLLWRLAQYGGGCSLGYPIVAWWRLLISAMEMMSAPSLDASLCPDVVRSSGGGWWWSHHYSFGVSRSLDSDHSWSFVAVSGEHQFPETCSCPSHQEHVELVVSVPWSWVFFPSAARQGWTRVEVAWHGSSKERRRDRRLSSAASSPSARHAQLHRFPGDAADCW